MTEKLVKKFNVGGVLIERPFKIRRLGHFGVNATDVENALYFYHSLLGFKIVDIRDPYPEGKIVPKEFEHLGDIRGYFFRYGHDHHALVLYNHLFRGVTDTKDRWRKQVTVNQITWQVGTLEEVVNANKWLMDKGCNMTKAGRDMPGSNWHTYLMDPDWFQNELYYGIEQIGWNGHSKPWEMHSREFKNVASLPQKSEYQEVNDALENGSNPASGYRDIEPLEEKYNVDGVLLGRPFKITKIGPVRLFCEDIDASLSFYRDMLGFTVTEETDYRGCRCIFMRNNTEHHSLALYPVKLRKKLHCRSDTLLFSFALRLANYRQLRDAVIFLRDEHGFTIRDDIPQEVYLGIDYTAFVEDPDNHLIQLYFYMEQVGWNGETRPQEERRKVTPGRWPETIEPASDSFMGEPFLGPLG